MVGGRLTMVTVFFYSSLPGRIRTARRFLELELMIHESIHPNRAVNHQLLRLVELMIDELIHPDRGVNHQLFLLVTSW